MACLLFFKQKTAYEMRISDWSSDVCSSDLEAALRCPPSRHRPKGCSSVRTSGPALPTRECWHPDRGVDSGPDGRTGWEGRPNSRGSRSEEHTSELQSLMRISYAVFCLKKKKKKYELIHI